MIQLLQNISSYNIVYDSQALISIDPVRARDDPVIVKNIPYHKAKRALEAEVMKLDPPPRPPSWGVRILRLHSIAPSSYFSKFVYFSIIFWIFYFSHLLKKKGKKKSEKW